jgi:hypothetical protein
MEVGRGRGQQKKWRRRKNKTPHKGGGRNVTKSGGGRRNCPICLVRLNGSVN